MCFGLSGPARQPEAQVRQETAVQDVPFGDLCALFDARQGVTRPQSSSGAVTVVLGQLPGLLRGKQRKEYFLAAVRVNDGERVGVGHYLLADQVDRSFESAQSEESSRIWYKMSKVLSDDGITKLALINPATRNTAVGFAARHLPHPSLKAIY